MDEIKYTLSQLGFMVVNMTPQRMAHWDLYEANLSMVALCLQGHCDLEANMERISFHPGMRLALSHVMTLRSFKVSADFNALILLVDRKLGILTTEGLSTPAMVRLFQPAAVEMDSTDEWDLVVEMFRCLQHLTTVETIPSRQQAGISLLHCITSVLTGISRQNRSGTEIDPYLPADNYFRNFLDLISQHVVEQHEVSFYAEQLGITPKYLNQICKQRSGYKAKEAITSALLTRIKREILVSGLSMKEIARRYHFSDQSSLGKFFRKASGMSPLEFRRSSVFTKTETL